jgi:hypothetical protein
MISKKRAVFADEIGCCCYALPAGRRNSLSQNKFLPIPLCSIMPVEKRRDRGCAANANRSKCPLEKSAQKLAVTIMPFADTLVGVVRRGGTYEGYWRRQERFRLGKKTRIEGRKKNANHPLKVRNTAKLVVLLIDF